MIGISLSILSHLSESSEFTHCPLFSDLGILQSCWDLDDMLIEVLSYSPSAAASMPDTCFGLAQTREHLCYESPWQEWSERGKLKTTVLSNNCPADAGGISVQTPALSVLGCRALQLHTYISQTSPSETSKTPHLPVVKSLERWDTLLFSPFLSNPWNAAVENCNPLVLWGFIATTMQMTLCQKGISLSSTYIQHHLYICHVRKSL